MNEASEVVSRQELIVDGRKLVLRQNEARSATSLLLLHGAWTSAKLWEQQERKLSRSHHVIIPELPGHGDSEPCPAPQHFDDLLRVLQRLCEQLERELVLVAQGLGAALALDLAWRHPQRIRALVLVACPFRFAFSPLLLAQLEKGSAAFASLLRELCFAPQHNARLSEKLLHPSSMPSLEVCRADFFACSSWSAGRGLRRMQVPSLIIAGRQDGLVPWPQCEALAMELSGSSIEIIEDAAHFPMLEQAQRVNELIASFASTRGNERRAS
ncbi:MAG: alpha/beta hydrolase [Myxococcota bacterium]|nr:alpha/beta hydrolase [Myxococcota bacterium]